MLVTAESIAEAEVNPLKACEDAVLIVVGIILPQKLFVSPIGNYNPQFEMQFKSSKFQLLLGPPSDTNFGPDFVTALNKLEKLQGLVSHTDD
ncbi:hypothetical protein APHAL10511_003368, partial [Amanita phalloides]